MDLIPCFSALQTYYSANGIVKLRRFWSGKATPSAASVENAEHNKVEPDFFEDELSSIELDDSLAASSSSVHFEGSGGKPGVISFYGQPYKQEKKVLNVHPPRTRNNSEWFLGPAVLVASFIFPSLYLRKILSFIFEDSLLTGNIVLFGACLRSSTSGLEKNEKQPGLVLIT